MIPAAQIKLYRLYNSFPVRVLRLLALVMLIVFLKDVYTHTMIPKLLLSLSSIFFMLEIFMHFKLGRYVPLHPLSAASQNLLTSFSRDSLFSVYDTKTTLAIKQITRFPQVKFLLSKAGIKDKELQIISLPLEQICLRAVEVARQVQGTYVTTMDIMAAYLFLTEAQTKLLFKHEIQAEDLYSILFWARSMYRQEEEIESPRHEFNGEGLGEVIISGWTPETMRYTRDFRITAFRQRPLLIGREQDYQLLLEALSKPENNNVLLIGEAGVGKETLIEAFVYDSTEGKVGGGLDHLRVLEVMVGQLIAGTDNRAELEERLQAIIEEVSHSGNVILYLPELQNILGGSTYSIDLSGALLPYLKSGHIPIIATLTPGNFKKFAENNPLREVLTLITLREPDSLTAMHMLFEKTSEIESETKTKISYEAVKAAIEHARKYLPDSVLPGSSVQLLLDTAHSIATDKTSDKIVTKEDVLLAVTRKTHLSVGAPRPEEKNLLLHLEEFLHQRVIGQNNAIAAVSEALRRIRAEMGSNVRPISFLFLGPTGVGKTETAKALAEAYYGGEDKMLRFDMSEYVGENGMNRLLGFAEQRGELTERVYDHPSSLILLDEFEKADPKVLNLLLQVFEDGRLTDNRGKTVSFADCIIIATSNAGSEYIRKEVEEGRALSPVFNQSLLSYLQEKSLFKPELLNRFDEVVVFTPLSEQEMVQVVTLLLTLLKQKLAKQDIALEYTPEVVQKIITEGSDSEFGARPLRRYIQNTLEDRIAKMKLQDLLPRGSRIVFTVDETGEFVQTVTPYK